MVRVSLHNVELIACSMSVIKLRECCCVRGLPRLMPITASNHRSKRCENERCSCQRAGQGGSHQPSAAAAVPSDAPRINWASGGCNVGLS
jgi:hypothetical protein